MLAMQLADLAKEVRALLAQYEQPVAEVYPPCGWNEHMMDLGPQGESLPEYEEEIPPMYPYQEYNNQGSYEQEEQDHQWSNHDNFSSTEQRMLNIEEVVDRVGFQLSEILQEVEEEKEEPPRIS